MSAASMAAARMLLQNSKVLPQSLRRQILSPSAINIVAHGTVLSDKPSVGGAPRQDHLSLWRQQQLLNWRQSPAFELSPRRRSVKNSDSEDEIEDLEKGPGSDSEWGDDFEDKEGFEESDPDDFYNSDEEKDTEYPNSTRRI